MLGLIHLNRACEPNCTFLKQIGTNIFPLHKVSANQKTDLNSGEAERTARRTRKEEWEWKFDAFICLPPPSFPPPLRRCTHLSQSRILSRVSSRAAATITNANSGVAADVRSTFGGNTADFSAAAFFPSHFICYAHSLRTVFRDLS